MPGGRERLPGNVHRRHAGSLFRGVLPSDLLQMLRRASLGLLSRLADLQSAELHLLFSGTGWRLLRSQLPNLLPTAAGPAVPKLR